MNGMNDAQFTRIAKALADPRRFEILRALSQDGEMSCGTVAERFPVGQSTISHHLKILVDAGLVEVRREGQHSYFAGNRDVLESYVEELGRRLLTTPDEHASDS